MKRFVLILVTLFIYQLNSNAQSTDTIPSDPDEKIMVNKEYDENGNLIRFDSTYVYQWSGSDTTMNINGNIFQFDHNSISNMKEMLNQFFNDSTMGNSPFSNHFFSSPFDFDDHFMDPFSSQGLPPDSTMKKLFEKLQSDELPDIFDHFNSITPKKFENEEKQKEWMELQKKHQKEMQEFWKKWEE